jgi:hypothetical protein
MRGVTKNQGGLQKVREASEKAKEGLLKWKKGVYKIVRVGSE